ncbi:undecaprenyldiphospho-muramoylpentapeptide beta-N-acetylglucosaminyltransferase [Paenactinomyces guangxiensis]|uniref:UDP-N-acetylglucosamine--N-acetylmuramyl-(pentapeptide) pyrophosphoryl-undecaprenol N-acetylglucosamine transferase n=1 Tax=Paenactinomyces guangxiensis TaxID=1490290 RepID=A0A7W2A5V0_9BACL|nr:undecaprenyldiphospho-muramoylpentapeptide beta-N-acetylglucosaminyltransferase [Paenactinomyces guangxiensis]MBA4492706.1 undecaprenyldiphospho-muramoylpentapeptide beta-N-acetylglucosaminyltransferase [Paenactinomyces guangxiensis]MBH8590446.1 undecaprenyldiphospho-muramoylpentapeptide beta-N-acetylglucosaminyltransferase [Paenactinomyces guangxiensis]
MSKKIIFTGGGSAGHVTVNLALIPEFLKEGWDVAYIGSENGIEKQLLSNVDKVPYFSISTGKLRRYFDWNNFKDPFKVLKGIFQAYRIIKKQKPHVVFSKGGFVSVPVVLGAWLNKVPIVIHESDLTPGLANRISIPFATKVCVTFPETKQHLPSDKAEYAGAIVRGELKNGDAARGLAYCNFTREKPVLLIMGGSLGSQRINQVLRNHIDPLSADFQIVHICGKGQMDPSITAPGYRQFEYINQELPDIMAMADFVVSRAGSNSIFEFLSLQKPMLLIPLSKAASRGDQILNAKSFEKSGFCEVLMEEDLTDDTFMNAVYKVFENRETYKENMRKSNAGDALQHVFALVKNIAR